MSQKILFLVLLSFVFVSGCINTSTDDVSNTNVETEDTETENIVIENTETENIVIENTENENTVIDTTENDLEEDETETNNEIKPSPSPGLKECDSFGCMSTSAETCEPVKYAGDLNETTFEPNTLATIYFEIQGMESGKCILYLRSETHKIEYSESYQNELLENGYSQEQIDGLLKNEEDALKAREGRDGECKFETSELSAMFARYEVGDLTSGVYDTVECAGDFFRNPGSREDD